MNTSMRKISNSRIYTFHGGSGTVPYLLPGMYLDRCIHDIIIRYISNDDVFEHDMLYFC